MSKTYRICRILRFVGFKRRPRTAAVILAGGTGSRMKSKDGQTKQMMELLGVPVLVHTARAFDACPYIDDLYVVGRPEELDRVQELMKTYRIRKFRAAVPGGATRQQSALRGFEAADGPKLGFVAIHDAARCLVTTDQISDVVAAAYAYRAAAAATRVHDTVKQANGDGFVTGTLDRSTLWFAQTPQVFRSDLYRAAAYTALDARFTATDDMMLCERIGQTVKLIDCGDENFKITTRQDFLRAERVLRERENGST